MPSLLPSRRRRKWVEGHWVNKCRAKPLRLQHLDCHWGAVLIESRPRLCDDAISVRSLTGWPARSSMRLGLADDSREIGWSIGALAPYVASESEAHVGEARQSVHVHCKQCQTVLSLKFAWKCWEVQEIYSCMTVLYTVSQKNCANLFSVRTLSNFDW